MLLLLYTVRFLFSDAVGLYLYCCMSLYLHTLFLPQGNTKYVAFV